jgi:hypothetical protein
MGIRALRGKPMDERASRVMDLSTVLEEFAVHSAAAEKELKRRAYREGAYPDRRTEMESGSAR